jgi:hypothetical protein
VVDLHHEVGRVAVAFGREPAQVLVRTLARDARVGHLDRAPARAQRPLDAGDEGVLDLGAVPEVKEGPRKGMRVVPGALARGVSRRAASLRKPCALV